MPVNDALDIRQPNAGTFKLGRLVKALKHAEQFARIVHIKSRAVVLHKVNNPVGLIHKANLDRRLLLFGRILDSVRDQVHPKLARSGRDLPSPAAVH